MKTRVFINGSEGTTGLRINERFKLRDDVELIPIASELRKDPAEVSKKINESDITFFCLPDAAAIEALTYVKNPNVRILDTSTAHRTNPGFAYGFPELSAELREKIRTGKRIAVPGCHASGFIALVYPLTARGIIKEDAPLTAVSITGYSGGGKKTIAAYNDVEARKASMVPSEKNKNGLDPLTGPRLYALGQTHKHLKEMTVIPGLSVPPVFMPYICDFYSGMYVTVPLHKSFLKKNIGVEGIREELTEHYKNASLVKVLPEGDELTASGFVPANTIEGRDDMEITVYGNDDRIMLSARFDNLGKGASGAAIECMNVILGREDAYGLSI